MPMDHLLGMRYGLGVGTVLKGRSGDLGNRPRQGLVRTLTLRVGSNGKYIFDEIYVFLIFPSYISSSFGSNRNIYFSRLEASEDFDPR